MPKAQPVIIVGRNRVSNIFYMVNDEPEYENMPWFQGSKDEEAVRKAVKPRVYPSKLNAKRHLDLLKRECYTTDWWTENVNN
jgi:hypothetical protein